MAADGAKKVEAEMEDLVKNDMINSWMGFKGPEGFWDGRVVTNGIDGFFKISRRGSTIMTEIRAGTASFMTLCYILAVHPRILSESGGPCVCGAETAADPDCVFYDGVYAECVEDFRRELVTVTAAASCIACVSMGLFGNLPFLLAPGMGLNAYFTYDVVGFHGTGKVKWRTAMAAIFIEGIIFMLLTISGLRLAFARAIPNCIKVATTGGIGFFLAHLGLQTAEGIGLVVTDVATGVTLGGCPPAARSYATYPPSPVTADAYTCDNSPGSQMTSATTWLGIMTLCIIGIMLKRGIRGGIIIGILGATFLSWIPGTLVSYWSDSVYPLGGGNGLEGGKYRWEYFKQVVKLERIDMAGAQMDFDFSNPQLGIALFTFLYVDLLDTTGTLFAMAKFMNIIQPDGKFEGDQKAFMVDGFSTMIGAVLGTSPVTTFIESAPGIEAGGRTGLTAIWAGFLFFLSLFFAPLLASIPPWATGPALIVVGAMMMRGLVNINWYNHGEAIPAWHHRRPLRLRRTQRLRLAPRLCLRPLARPRRPRGPHRHRRRPGGRLREDRRLPRGAPRPRHRDARRPGGGGPRARPPRVPPAHDGRRRPALRVAPHGVPPRHGVPDGHGGVRPRHDASPGLRVLSGGLRLGSSLSPLFQRAGALFLFRTSAVLRRLAFSSGGWRLLRARLIASVALCARV
mmetsp:Transcript_43044/g.107714  ORF Transcript_43044/g.107714 Transcript_43044/m.107714 type:complete len:683 (+) Transcript_43044:89-2137(+)